MVTLIFIFNFINTIYSAELMFPCSNAKEIMKMDCLGSQCKYKASKAVETGRAWHYAENNKILLYADQTGKVIFSDWKNFEDSTRILASHCSELKELSGGMKNIQSAINLKYTNRLAIKKKIEEKRQAINPCEEIVRVPFKNFQLEAKGIKETCVPKK